MGLKKLWWIPKCTAPFCVHYPTTLTTNIIRCTCSVYHNSNAYSQAMVLTNSTFGWLKTMMVSSYPYTVIYSYVLKSCLLMIMLPEFNYILVSDEDNGTQFSNICNQELNFQDEPYEVCMQDMIFSIGSWNQVREGGNTITVTYENEPAQIIHSHTGRYTKESLINEINVRFETIYNDGN